eukprot:919412-Rhodomonas_salina.3
MVFMYWLSRGQRSKKSNCFNSIRSTAARCSRPSALSTHSRSPPSACPSRSLHVSVLRCRRLHKAAPGCSAPGELKMPSTPENRAWQPALIRPMPNFLIAPPVSPTGAASKCLGRPTRRLPDQHHRHARARGRQGSMQAQGDEQICVCVILQKPLHPPELRHLPILPGPLAALRAAPL